MNFKVIFKKYLNLVLIRCMLLFSYLFYDTVKHESQMLDRVFGLLSILHRKKQRPRECRAQISQTQEKNKTKVS